MYAYLFAGKNKILLEILVTYICLYYVNKYDGNSITLVFFLNIYSFISTLLR